MWSPRRRLDAGHGRASAVAVGGLRGRGLEPAFALPIFALWLLAGPRLAIGLGQQIPSLIRAAGLLLTTAIAMQVVYGVRVIVRAGRPLAAATS